MPWIETDNANLKTIRIDGLSDDVHFTDNQYAEVSSEVASLLESASGVSGITVLDTAPSSPGEYFGSDVDNTVITVSLGSDTFDSLSVLNDVSSKSVSTAHAGIKHGHSRPTERPNSRRQSARRQGALVVIYDDGYAGEYDRAFDVHKQHGVPGNTAVITEYLDEDGYLTARQLREMVASDVGWGALSHGRYSTRFATTTLDGSHSSGATTLTISSLNGAFPKDAEGNVPDYTYVIGDYGSGTRETITLADVDTSASTITIAEGLQNSHSDVDIIHPTEETISRDLGGAVDDLRQIGVGTPSGHVWSGNATGNIAARSIASQFFEAARSDHSDDEADMGAAGLNDTPLNRYSLAGTGISMSGTSLTLDQWLSRIADENLLGIAYYHTNDNTQGEADAIDTFLTAATQKDLDILTFDEAIARFNDSADPIQQHRAPETGRRLWLPMTRGSGGTVFDASGLHNDATFNGTPTYETGQLGRAAVLTGSNSLTVPNSSSIEPGAGDYSIVIELKTDGIGSGRIIDMWSSGSGGYYVDYSSSGQVRMFIDDGSSSTISSRDMWLSGDNDVVQIAFIRDTTAGEIRLYLNSSHDRNAVSTNDPTGDVTSGLDMQIGGGNDFDLYNLEIFNRVVTRQELHAWHLQNMGSNLYEGDLRGLDAGKGVVVTTPDGTAEYRLRVDDTGSILTEQI